MPTSPAQPHPSAPPMVRARRSAPSGAMPGRSHGLAARGLAVALAATVSSCITSKPWEHGPTADVKQLQLEPCPNGLLDNGEDGNSQILTVQDRDGYWFTFADEVGTTIEPKGEFKMTPGGPEGSQHTARATGRTAKSGDSIYAGLGFALTNPKTPYDMSHAKGIRFWAKGPGKVRFKTPDVNTAPEGDRCTDCYNDFGVDIFLSETWERYTVPFDKMAQQPGWGDRAPAVTAAQVFAVQWQFGTPDTQYDIAIDNVELVGCGQQ